MEISRLALPCLVLGFLLILGGSALPLLWPALASWTTSLQVTGSVLLAGYLFWYLHSLRATASTRSTRLGLHSLLSVCLAVTIAILCNFLAARHAPEWDVSETQHFTLSRQTYAVLRQLPRAVRITVFSHRDSPGYGPYQDLLTTYAHESPLITVEFIDPERQPDVAKEYHITKIDTAVLTSGNQTIYVHQADEAAVTNALLRVTRDQKKQLAFLTGHGEPSLSHTESSGLSRLQDALSKQGYDIQTLDLATLERAIQASVLVIASPSEPIPAEQADAIASFVQTGGRLLLLADPGKPIPLAPLLASWGITMGEGILADSQDRLGRGSPTALLVRTFTTHDITEDFTAPILFPVSRAVSFDADTAPEWDSMSLAQTSPQSWEETDRTRTPPTFDPDEDTQGPFTVAMLFTSKARESDKGPASAMVVIGNSAFATNGYFTYPGNTDFLLKTVAWLAKEDALVTITPKDPAFHPFVPNPSQEQALVFFQVLFLPLLTLVLGMSVWKRRRSL